MKVVPDPLGSGLKVLEYAIADSDRPYSEATNPRGDVESPSFWVPGSDAYVSEPTLIPVGFPLVNKGWWMVWELYGKPFGGSPPTGLYLWDVGGSNHFILQRQGKEVLWTGPALDGRWHIPIEHVHFATDGSAFIELWYDGVQQKFSNGLTKISYVNLVAGVNWDGTDANFLDINSYREAGAFPGTWALDHAAPTVAPSLAVAQSTPHP